MAFDRGTYKYTADRPRILLNNVRAAVHAPKYKLERLTVDTPFAFETVHKPQTGAYYEPYPQRKVKLHVNVAALNLPPLVRKRLVNFATSRGYFNPGKETLTVSCMKENTRAQNRAYCVHLVRELLHEAWKADLNYLPPPDKLTPSQQVLLEQEAKKQKKEDAMGEIKQAGQFTLFRFHSWPTPKQLQQQQKTAEKQFNSLFKTLVKQ